MGCCQSSTVSNNDQVTVELSKEQLNKQDSLIDTIQVNYIPDIQLLRFENQKTSTPTSPDTLSYSLTGKISSYSTINRYSCIQSNSGQLKEAIIIKKSTLFQTDCEKLIENTLKVSQFCQENIVKVLFVSEDKDYVKIVTDPCGEKSLDDVTSNNKIPFGPALTFIKQIMQGIMQFHKLGVILKHLTEKDVFLVNNSVKISVSAMVQKMSEFDPPDFEVNLKNDVWSLGVIFLKLLLAPYELKSIQDGLEKLDQLKLHEDDCKNIKNFFKPLFQRPGLPEVIQYKWQSSSSSPDFRTGNKNYIIEKISEEISENFSFEENQSARIEKSEGSSNEFYQSEELEDPENDSGFNEWQEVDVNHGTIRVCEILNDEMKEIIESIPDHEVSSIENQSLDKSNPCSPSSHGKNILIIPRMEFKSEDLSQCNNLPLSSSLLELHSEDDTNPPINTNFIRKFTLNPLTPQEKSGQVKFFSIQKRAGILICEESGEEFLFTQDELIISKVNVKRFTKQLMSGEKPQLKFSICPETGKVVEISLQ
jgi:hypothetical protein